MPEFDKRRYDMDYAKQHIKRKHIPFNELNPDDAELLEWLDKQGNITQYVKALIRDDMNRIRSQNGSQTGKTTAGSVEK